MAKVDFSKYERARIIGARGLQISMDAPLLLKMDEEELNGVNFDPLRIAEKELDSGVLPISVNRPMPSRREEAIETIRVVETDVSDADKEKTQADEEREISESGEMMQLANNSEEVESISEDDNPEDI